MPDEISCPIWGSQAISDESSFGDYTCVDSARAGGKYWIDGRSMQVFTNWNSLPYSEERNRKKARLTSWLINQRRLGVTRPQIHVYEIEEVFRRPDMSVHARADQLLKYIQGKSAYIGSRLELPKNDEEPFGQELFAYTESTNSYELVFLLNFLVAQNWLNEISETFGYVEVEITVDGFSRLAEVDNEVSISSRAFVAMWFHESTNQAWEAGIKPGIEDSGYEAVRIDRQEHVNKIDDQIIAEINRSRFIVADFTQGSDGARGGVYYEAGYAHGLGLPVIFTCREDVFENIHFDTRQYNHIVWENVEDLRRSLSNRISAAIGDGPYSTKTSAS